VQTLTVHVEDDFLTKFMQMVEDVKENVTVQQDKNLILDSYFYERQKELRQIRDDIKNSKMPTHHFETSMNLFVS
jgi:hypothetical protein